MSISKTIFRKKRGFLLLEVLVSIAIISLGLVYIVRSFSSSTKAIESGGRFLESVALIEEKLWELEAKGAIEKGKDEGRFKKHERYRWEYEAKGLDDVPINIVKLKVEWKGPGETKRRQRVTVETYLWNEE